MQSSGAVSQALCAAASRPPSGATAIVGIHPDTIDASSLHTTAALPSSAIVPQAWRRPLRPANHSEPSSRQERQLTSMCGASTAAAPLLVATTLVSPARMPRSEQNPSAKATRAPSGERAG